MKKTLCILLVALTVFCFSACRDDAKDEPPAITGQKSEDKAVVQEPDHTEEAKEAAVSFMEALCVLDVEAMSRCCVDEKAVREAFPFQSIEEHIKQSAYGYMPPESKETLEPMLGPIVDAYVEAIKGTFAYSVKDCAGTESGYVCDVDFRMMDFSASEAIISSTMSEEAIGNMGEEVAEELDRSGAITAESTADEIMNAMFEAVSVKIAAKIKAAVKDTPAVSRKLKIPVVEHNGEWLVDMAASNVAESLQIR